MSELLTDEEIQKLADKVIKDNGMEALEFARNLAQAQKAKCDKEWQEKVGEEREKYKNVMVKAEQEYNTLRSFASRYSYPMGRCKNLLKLFQVLRGKNGEGNPKKEDTRGNDNRG